MAEMRLILLLLGTAVIFAVITLLLNFTFKKRRYIKYIPPVAVLFFGAYNFYLIFAAENNGFEDIARGIFGVISLTGFISGLVCAVLLDILHARRKSKS